MVVLWCVERPAILVVAIRLLPILLRASLLRVRLLRTSLLCAGPLRIRLRLPVGLASLTVWLLCIRLLLLRVRSLRLRVWLWRLLSLSVLGLPGLSIRILLRIPILTLLHWLRLRLSCIRDLLRGLAVSVLWIRGASCDRCWNLSTHKESLQRTCKTNFGAILVDVGLLVGSKRKGKV